MKPWLKRLHAWNELEVSITNLRNRHTTSREVKTKVRQYLKVGGTMKRVAILFRDSD